MRNGIDISSFSEIIHEIQNDERQAQFRYSAGAQWYAGNGLFAYVKPAIIGNLKSPRRFVYPIKPLSCNALAVDRESAFPIEIAMVALSGCFLVSVVSGLSAQRCTIENLYLKLDACIRNSNKYPPQVYYEIGAQTDQTIDRIEDVVNTVKKMSPNHRTFESELDISVLVGSSKVPMHFASIDANAQEPSNGIRSDNIHIKCEWDYGTQLKAFLFDTNKQSKRFPIDQPKQLGGIDWAPNPQEYLLMALSSDLLNEMLAIDELGKKLPDLNISAKAHVDIRGMCDVADVPVHLQGICIQIESTGSLESLDKDLQALIDRAINNSAVCKIIRQKVKFEFSIKDLSYIK